MTPFAGALYMQYQQFIAPDTVGGIGISPRIVFAVVAGGIFVMLGPTVGAIITLLLAETLRVTIISNFGTAAIGIDNTIHGLPLVLFIIFLPKGILGGLLEWWGRRGEPGDGDQAAGRPAPQGGDD